MACQSNLRLPWKTIPSAFMEEVEVTGVLEEVMRMTGDCPVVGGAAMMFVFGTFSFRQLDTM